jgi:hypothetical protein
MRQLGIVLALAAVAGCSAPDERETRAHELSLAITGNTGFAAWHGGPPPGSRVYLQRLDAAGDPAGAPIPVSEEPGLAYEPDLVFAGQDLALAWYERAPDSGRLTAWLAAVDADGQLQWRVPLAGGGAHARSPVARYHGGALEVAWIELANPRAASATIRHQRFSLRGRALTEPAAVGEASGETWNLNAATHEGALLLAYDAALGSKAHEIQLLVIDGEGVRQIRASEDDGHASLYPDVQPGPGGRLGLTWFDERDGNREVYLWTGTLGELATRGLARALRVTDTPGETIGAYAAWHGGTIGLAWNDTVRGQRELFTRLFAADGQPLAPIIRLSKSAHHAGVPAIRAAPGGFWVAWNDYGLTGSGSHGNVTSSQARFARVPLRR